MATAATTATTANAPPQPKVVNMTPYKIFSMILESTKRRR
jgi:hypothetical protein